MTKIINAYKLRTNLGEYLNEVYYKGNEVVVERRGRPLVKIIRVGAIEHKEDAEKRAKFLSLAGSLPKERADEMKATIQKARKLSRQMVKL